MNADILLDSLHFLNRNSLNRLLSLNSTTNYLINKYFSFTPTLQVLNLQLYSPEKVHMQLCYKTYRLHEALLEEALPFLIPKYVRCQCTYITFDQHNDDLFQALPLFSHVWKDSNLYFDVKRGTNMELFKQVMAASTFECDVLDLVVSSPGFDWTLFYGCQPAAAKCKKLVVYAEETLSIDAIIKYLHSGQGVKNLSLKYPHGISLLQELVAKIIEVFNEPATPNRSFELNFQCDLEDFELVDDNNKECLRLEVVHQMCSLKRFLV